MPTLPKLPPKLQAYLSLTRLNRPIGILLLLWPTLWALWIAGNGQPSLKYVIIFIAGVVLMRSAGCAINDYFDRGFDGQVTRTRHRPLVTGQLSPHEAIGVFVILCLLSAGLLFLLPKLAWWFAVPAVAITVIYPYLKRITHLPQLMLGVAFSWGIPMAFAAQAGHIPWVAWFVFLISYVWIVAYDTMYAMADRPDDLKAGVKSTAILWGDKDIWVIAALHIVMLLLLVVLGIWLSLGAFYYCSLVAAAGMMIYLHYLIKDRVPELCFKAFRKSHWVGFVVLVGLVIAR